LSAEPGTSAASVRALSGMLASSHRLAHALMALEAGLWQESRSTESGASSSFRSEALAGPGALSASPAAPRAAFTPFANDVELTLYYLAAMLRGSPLRRAALPDLREAHRTLAHSEDSRTGRFALVNVETDRVTNSVNTLSEEVL
ncbi:MAG: hypothetical protein ACREH9_02255, partial [Pseudomonadota bacterium]